MDWPYQMVLHFILFSSISSTTNLYVWTGAMNSILTIQTYNYQLISKLHTYTYIQSYMFVGWGCQSKNQVHWWTFTFPIFFVGQNVPPNPIPSASGRQVTGCFGSTFLLSTLFCGFKVQVGKFPWKPVVESAPLELEICFTPMEPEMTAWKGGDSEFASNDVQVNKHWRYFNLARPLRLISRLELESVTMKEMEFEPTLSESKRKRTSFLGSQIRWRSLGQKHQRFSILWVASQDLCIFGLLWSNLLKKVLQKMLTQFESSIIYYIFAVVKYIRIILHMFILYIYIYLLYLLYVYRYFYLYVYI